jgi:hypothetical protein
MIKYLSFAFFLVILTNCGRPERKLANIKKDSAAVTAKNLTDTVVPKTQDDEAMHENRFDVARISGKSKEEINQYLGEPASQEKVTVKGNINNCEKITYVEGMVEVIFINGKADWIKINDDPEMVLIPAKNDYISVEKFPDYIFVKSFTK